MVAGCEICGGTSEHQNIGTSNVEGKKSRRETGGLPSHGGQHRLAFDERFWLPDRGLHLALECAIDHLA
jgi:hypothetical protein